MAKVANVNSLPSNTTIENILKLIEIYKRKSNDKEARPLFGKGGTAYSCTKSALRSFGLIGEKDCEFTKSGKLIAHSTDDQKREYMLDIVLQYSPYESFLHVVFSNNEVSETNLTLITNNWGRFEFGSNQINREDGAILFGNILEFIGLGKFTVGRGKNVTRIVWEENSKQIYTEALSRLNPQETEDANQQISEEIGEVITETASGSEDTIEETNQVIISEDDEQDVVIVNKAMSRIKIAPNINVNVDMSGWEEEKIKSFFKYAYGIFEEE